MSVLGLDISTACTGWCVLSNAGEIVKIGYIDLSKEKSLFSKAKIVKNKISHINIDYEIEKIFIEENLQSFRSGFSSAKTISTLAKFNGIVSFICFEEFSKVPIFFNVNSARKLLEISIKRKGAGGAPVKEQLLEWAKNNVQYDWPVKTLKSGPRKGIVVNDPRGYDMVDAYVIARAGLLSCKL
jgi:Holliday junction resolvasome RuvABC endonuclease subunit